MSAGKQWNLNLVRAEEAFAKLPRFPNTDDVDWNEIEVGHIDTGIRMHNATGPWSRGKSPIMRLSDGVNYRERGTPPLDSMDYKENPGHGTRTSSVICGNDPGQYKGVAPGVPVIPYRAVDSVVLITKDRRKRVAQAIRHAVVENGCEVISLSLGTPVLNMFGARLMGSAVDLAYENGVIVVAAGGQVIDKVTYPGKFFRSIGVGGVKENREIWFKYDAGMDQFISVWAPADDVPRANSQPAGDGSFEHSYGDGDGTSYATAHVAGAAAMWLTYHAQALDKKYSKPWMRIEAFRTLLRLTAQPIQGGYTPDNGTGILNIEALLDAPLPDADSLEEEERLAADMWG